MESTSVFGGVDRLPGGMGWRAWHPMPGGGMAERLFPECDRAAAGVWLEHERFLAQLGGMAGGLVLPQSPDVAGRLALPMPGATPVPVGCGVLFADYARAWLREYRRRDGREARGATFLPMVGKTGFPLMLAQARADLDDIARAQDRAIATLEHVRAWLEEEAGDYVVEGVVSSMKGHLGVGKSEIGCDIDTLRMIGDRYDRQQADPTSARTIARSEGADARDGRKDPARPAPPTADPAHGTPRHAKGDKPAPAPMESETHAPSIPTSPVRYDRLWKERVEPYLRQNGGWRLWADIKAICEKEAKENGSKPRSVANGIRRAAQRTDGRLRSLKLGGTVSVWYLADIDPDDVAARARQDPRVNG